MLRETFDAVAERYDRVRPRYPAALVDAIVTAAGLGEGSRVLEIAPGTGQLTVPLAATGCRLTAVELGASLAAVARRNLADRPRAEVVVADFDTWEVPAGAFDLVACATAFHWLDPATRVARTAAALRPGGLLAVVVTEHVAGGTTQFFHDSQAHYEHWDPSTPPGPLLKDASEVAADTGEFGRDPRYEAVSVRRFVQDVTYTADGYLEVLLTYSGHLALDEPSRAGLLAALRELIDTRYGGTVTKRYLHELVTARRTLE
ncbi:methyltransferase domain-containing protein [Streptomyces roseirectus]|uniref:Methyltransferase domain-containing protein n=1 Tax=Streptomyces roseirectus TaxID=2768066 RepID=A0A7H0I6R6_9ACTN|nr:methyltransferase domain-containing protein [Streptomyces roseirectus]QNP68482.1 methyltransferase domain-containing protein [Streptomyces roseirectus]